MKDNFNHHAWIRNQHLKENQDNILSPQEYLKKYLPHVYNDGNDIDYFDALQAMEDYAEYVQTCKEQ